MFCIRRSSSTTFRSNQSNFVLYVAGVVVRVITFCGTARVTVSVVAAAVVPCFRRGTRMFSMPSSVLLWRFGPVGTAEERSEVLLSVAVCGSPRVVSVRCPDEDATLRSCPFLCGLSVAEVFYNFVGCAVILRSFVRCVSTSVSSLSASRRPQLRMCGVSSWWCKRKYVRRLPP